MLINLVVFNTTTDYLLGWTDEILNLNTDIIKDVPTTILNFSPELAKLKKSIKNLSTEEINIIIKRINTF